MHVLVYFRVMPLQEGSFRVHILVSSLVLVDCACVSPSGLSLLLCVH